MLNLLDSDKCMIFVFVFIFEIDVYVSCKYYKYCIVYLVLCVILIWFVLNWFNLLIILNFDKN